MKDHLSSTLRHVFFIPANLVITEMVHISVKMRALLVLSMLRVIDI